MKLRTKPWRFKSESDLVEAVDKAVYDYTGENYKIDLVLNCTGRAHEEAPKDKSLYGCWGVHVVNLDAQMHCDVFKRNLAALKRALRNAEPGSVVNAICLCRQGRHRSVAAARLLAWGAESASILVNEIIHVNDDQWEKLCAGGCPNCSSKNSERDAIQSDMVDLWHADE